MTLLITLIAAVTATVIWYFSKKRSEYRLGTLSLIYWGAALMWFVDFIYEYIELGAEYFEQNISDMVNDAALGVTAVIIGLVAWLVILLIKDPNEVIKNKLKSGK